MSLQGQHCQVMLEQRCGFMIDMLRLIVELDRHETLLPGAAVK